MTRPQLIIQKVEAIRPLLAGLSPDIQGAVLADLCAIWLAGHPPQTRESMLAFQLDFIRTLIPINDRLIFGEAGHPSQQAAN